VVCELREEPMNKKVAIMETVKLLARAVAAILVIPFLLSYWVRSACVGKDRAFFSSSQMFALFPGLPGQYLRRAFYVRTMESFHPTAVVEFGTLFSRQGTRLAENVYIGPMCHIGLVDIEPDVLVASNVSIPSGPKTHGTADVDRPIRGQPGVLQRVRIGTGAWIGLSAIVMADVGARTVVASGAIVTRPLPADVVAGGVPAEVIKKRESSTETTV